MDQIAFRYRCGLLLIETLRDRSSLVWLSRRLTSAFIHMFEREDNPQTKFLPRQTTKPLKFSIFFYFFFFQNSGIQENRLFTYSLGSKCKRIIFNLDNAKSIYDEFFVVGHSLQLMFFKLVNIWGVGVYGAVQSRNSGCFCFVFLYIGYTTYTTTVGYTIQVCLSSLLYIALRLYSYLCCRHGYTDPRLSRAKLCSPRPF